MDLVHDDTRDAAHLQGLLVSAYIDLSIPSESSDNIELTIRAARLLTPRVLRGLAREVRDPFPWVLFLRRLLQLPATPGALAAFGHVYEIAQDMLAEQGFELVRPEDLLATCPLERRLHGTGLVRFEHHPHVSPAHPPDGLP